MSTRNRNDDLVQCPGWGFRFFRRWTRVLLPAGTRLFKFTEPKLFDGGRTTPWWALTEPRSDLADTSGAPLCLTA